MPKNHPKLVLSHYSNCKETKKGIQEESYLKHNLKKEMNVIWVIGFFSMCLNTQLV